MDIALSAPLTITAVAVAAVIFTVAQATLLLVVARRLQAADVALHYNDASPTLQRLLRQLRVLRRGYSPPPLLPIGFLQSGLAEAFQPAAAETRYDRETLHLPELRGATSQCCPDVVPAGLVSVDWLSAGCAPDTPICILVPGLTGSSGCAYVRRAAIALHRAGVRVGCYNPRSRGGNKLLSPFLYSAGYTEDLRRVVAHVHRAFPGAPICAAGYSLGASYLSKYVAEEGEACVLAGAVAFACPVDVPEMSTWLGASPISRYIDEKHLVPSVKQMLARCHPRESSLAISRPTHRRAQPMRGRETSSHLTARYEPDLAGRGSWDLPAAAAARTMRQFDDATIAGMMGCDGVGAYYREAAATHSNARIGPDHLLD
jgi:predicted alpha/beta-fold hydrolase